MLESLESRIDGCFTPEELYLFKRRDILLDAIMDGCNECGDYLCLQHMQWLEPLFEDLNKIEEFEGIVFGSLETTR